MRKHGTDRQFDELKAALRDDGVEAHDANKIGKFYNIVVDLLKIFNYCQLEGKRGLFLVELAFLSNFVVWAYYRLYYLFWNVIIMGVLVGAREVSGAA